MITAEKVSEIFKDCLFKDEEMIEGKPIIAPVEVEGIISRFGFHPDRIKIHAGEIIELLNELPEEFKEKTGGGWSFLNACNDKEGRQWGEHNNMEQLFSLGIAIGKVKYCMPKEMWSMLPGGMPYLVILKESANAT